MKKGIVIGSIVTGILVLAVVTHSNVVKPTKAEEFAKVTAMITRYDGRSGGSGVILSSKTGVSTILTNAHVCHVVENGGIVSTDFKRGSVTSYQVSNVHDLCLITVNTDFKVGTVLAEQEPESYDEAIVSGHPHLLPTIVTKGHFSNKEMITIMTELRQCTPDEMRDNPLLCDLMGGMPVVRNYEAQVISATIQPGSSGSAVFNDKGEISGLVFAGSGDFGYGMIVPFEYLYNFINVELPLLNPTKPNQFLDSVQLKQQNWKTVCVLDNADVQNACNLISKSLLITN